MSELSGPHYTYLVVDYGPQDFVIMRYLQGTRVSEYYGTDGGWVGTWEAAKKYSTKSTADYALEKMAK